MLDDRGRSRPRRWAELRFSIIGPLLACPPEPGALGEAIREQSRKLWVHPETGDLVTFGASTIERWYYKARPVDDPIAALTAKVRRDRGVNRAMSPELLEALRAQYLAHRSWSYQLHRDNLSALCELSVEPLGKAPSTSTVRRRMIENGWVRRRVRRNPTDGQKKAEERLEKREVSSWETSYVHQLWHYDFHEAHRKVVLPNGNLVKPVLFGALDDCSRVCLHLQWYLVENTENLFHGLSQAYLKYGLPRSEIHDDGSAMKAAEIKKGAKRLGIIHFPTLPYSPYQNGKQETFWDTVESRLMAMLEKVEPLELDFLNRATAAWVELDYNRSVHSELGVTPIERMLEGSSVSRTSPSLQVLRQRFTRTMRRTQRKSDGTITIDGVRFELPNRFRTTRTVLVGYQKWNMALAHILDERTEEPIARILPLDKERNASGRRRVLTPLDGPSAPPQSETQEPLPPLMRKILADYAATGLPPAYLPKDELATKDATNGEDS
jgi:transposase InsO family protein